MVLALPLLFAAAFTPLLPRAPLPLIAAPAHVRCTPLPIAQFADAPRRQPVRGRKRETLLAKGIAGAVLLRVAYSSRAAFFAASLAAPIIAVAPVVAVEALIFTALLVVTGAASYWPTNLVAMSAGAAGFAGCFNSVMVFFEKRSIRRRETKLAATKRKPRRSKVDDDGSGDLVALTIGAIAAAIIGALP